MARSFEVKVLGGPELTRALDGATRDLLDMGPVNQRAASTLTQAVAAAAPKVSGTLAGSFRPNVSKNRASAQSDLIYAPVIDYGHPAHNIEAQHYTERALKQSAGAIEKIYADGVDRICKKAES